MNEVLPSPGQDERAHGVALPSQEFFEAQKKHAGQGEKNPGHGDRKEKVAAEADAMEIEQGHRRKGDVDDESVQNRGRVYGELLRALEQHPERKADQDEAEVRHLSGLGVEEELFGFFGAELSRGHASKDREPGLADVHIG